MKKKSCLISFILLLMVGGIYSCKPGPEYRVPEIKVLNEGWNFQMEGDSVRLPASVPGCVHTDLLANNKIPDPFYRNNEQQLQWIDKENWIYTCEFTLDSLKMDFGKVLLRFDGLDTYASVKLNGQDILEADNMFRTWSVEAGEYLQPGINTLEVLFTSPVTKGLEKLDALGYGLPAVNDQSERGELGNRKVSVFTRKAPYHYGWDWGPRFVTSGIWRPVELQFINQVKIENLYFRQSLVNPYEASVEAILDIDAVVAGDYDISISQKSDKDPFVSTKVELAEGPNNVTIPFVIRDPELWWPNGMGEQFLYDLKVDLRQLDVIVDTLSAKLGVRSLELIREPDENGTSFYFSVNGKPVFAKGANYIPNDNFLNRVTNEKYEDIIRAAAEANMNMLRVWGGGIYENDIFYDLCDKYGIMVWQDLMFACSMYPGDDEFLANVEQEVIDNVKRLQNHPSIALWCGNNEIDAAWCEGDMNCGWGWKQRYTRKQRKEIWHAYDTLFHHILPEIIEIYDPVRSYWPSSPLADWGEHASYSSTGKGDIHYWGVWHGNEPFSSFYKVIGRFMSEYGFQALPDMQSIRRFTLPADWDFESEVLLSHQRSGYGNSRITDYMEKLYPVPEDFSCKLYVGQVMQAEAIKSAILAHRAHKPHCMGTLYWQLNDCWPSASWSSIDYYGSRKALQYFAKKAYEPTAIAFFPDQDSVRIILASDLQEPKLVYVNYSICDFNGKKLKEEQLDVLMDPEKGTEVFALSEKEMADKYDLNAVYLSVEVIYHNELLMADHYFFVPPKDLALPEVSIRRTTEVKGSQVILELESDELVKNLFLWTEKCPSKFSDNYFDLLPGQKVSVSIDPCGEIELTPQDVRMLTLNELVDR